MQLIAEGVQVASLVGALCAQEITMGEFSDSLRMLTPEAVQVLATTLQFAMIESERPEPRLVAARAVAIEIASERRSFF